MTNDAVTVAGPVGTLLPPDGLDVETTGVLDAVPAARACDGVLLLLAVAATTTAVPPAATAAVVPMPIHNRRLCQAILPTPLPTWLVATDPMWPPPRPTPVDAPPADVAVDAA